MPGRLEPPVATGTTLIPLLATLFAAIAIADTVKLYQQEDKASVTAYLLVLLLAIFGIFYALKNDDEHL